MSVFTVPVLLGLLMVSAAASLLVLWVIGLTDQNKAEVPSASDTQPLSNTFLFHGDELIDHDAGTLADHLTNLEELTGWSDMRQWLGARFHDLPISLSELANGIGITRESREDTTGDTLILNRNGAVTRLVLTRSSAPSPAEWHFADAMARMSHASQSVLDHAPFPIWKTDTTDDVIWQNTPCNGIVQRLGALPKTPRHGSGEMIPTRFSVPSSDSGQPSWYEVTSHSIADDQALHFATAIDQVIRAESAQRDFVQTLTKTFANLTTGLAVFDKNSQLALFNPALVDLTGLAVTFLSARPDVIRFFDELRERQVLPEPKNYANLRTQIRDVIAQAHVGNYQEVIDYRTGCRSER